MFIIILFLVAIKQKRQNYGFNEFVIRAFDGDGQVVGRFDDQQTGNFALRPHTCPNGASVCIQKRFIYKILISFFIY